MKIFKIFIFLLFVFSQIIISNAQNLPRIMVIFDEKIDGTAVDTRLVASKMEEILLSKGFRLVDKAQFENVTARDIAIAEGNPARAKELGMRYGAELIIVGKSEGLFESEKEFYGVKNYEYTSKGDCRVIITDTGELIAVSSKTTKKSAGGKNSAASLALNLLGESLANDIYAKIQTKLKEEETGPKIVQLALIGIDQNKIAEYEKSLTTNIPIITNLKLRYFEKEAAVFEATITKTIDTLRYEILKRNDLVVIAFTGTRLDLSTKDFADKAKSSAVVLSPLEITQFAIENIFPSQINYYAYNPLAKIELENSAKTEIKNVKVSIFIPGYMALPSEQIVPSIGAGAKQSFNLSATLDAKQLYTISANTTAQAKVELSYTYSNQPQNRSLVKPVTIYSRNTINWKRGESIGAFITHTDESVVNFSRHVVGALANNQSLQSKLPKNVINAMAIWNGIRANGYSYISDPWKSSEGDMLDLIQYPRETLSSRTGDCDDASVLLTSCLENIGIKTKFILTNDHIFLMFDTELDPKNGYMVSQNESDYVIHEGSVWIPLEATMINNSFLNAWKTGAEEYQKNSGAIELVDVRKASAAFPPANLSIATKNVTPPPSDKILALAIQDLSDYDAQQSNTAKVNTENLAEQNTPEAKNKIAIIQAKAGNLDNAIAALSGISTWQAENTLGNIYLLKNDMSAAQEHYQKSLDLNKDDGGVYLNFGLARYLAGSTEDAVEAFQVAISKFDSVEQAYQILGLSKLKESLGIRGAEQSAKISKNDLFALLSQSLKNIPDKNSSITQAQKVRAKYKDDQNRYVFGGRRGADPTQIASVKEFIYWKE